jgi:multidrug efflux pump subunit AcrB
MKVESRMVPHFESGLIQRGVVSVPGWGGGGAGIVNVTLRPWDERTMSTQELLQELNRGWSRDPRHSRHAFMRSGIAGSGGGGQPVQIVLGGPNYEELARWRDIIIDRASENPGLLRLDSDLRETQPQVLVRVDTTAPRASACRAQHRSDAADDDERAAGHDLRRRRRGVRRVLQARPEQRATLCGSAQHLRALRALRRADAAVEPGAARGAWRARAS